MPDPAGPIQRVHYFEGQFLHEADFTADQDYHREMLRHHNRALHEPGIASGLDVEFDEGQTSVTVQPGLAIDGEGREIVLLDELAIDLADFEDESDVYLTIAYRETPARELDETGVKGHTRWEEVPELKPLKNPPEGNGRVLVAKIGRDAKRKITSVERPTRDEVAEKPDSEIRLSSPEEGADPKDAVTLAWDAAKAARLAGSLTVEHDLDVGGNLHVTGGLKVDSELTLPSELRASGLALTAPDGTPYPDGSIGMAKDLEGSTKWLRVGGITDAGARRLALLADRTYVSGSLGIGTTKTDRPLHVEGNEIHSGGAGAGLSFANREAKEFVQAPAKGERWVWYASGGSARLWSGSDKLAVAADGKLGVGTTMPEARLHVADGSIRWGNNSELIADQGGSIELGGNSATKGAGTPYIDFHHNGLVQDYNARIINDADGRLSFVAPTVFASGNVGLGGDLTFQQIPQAPARALPAGATLVWNDGTWLRLNQNRDFSKPIHGVHTPGVFAPLSLNVGGAGNWGDPGGGNVWVTGSVGIGTTAPKQKLEVAGNMLASNAFIGNVGHGPDWPGLCHVGAVGPASYGFIQHTSGMWTLINKRSGGGHIGFRVDNVDKMTVRDNGSVWVAGNLGTHGYDPNQSDRGWDGGVHTWDVEAEASIWTRTLHVEGDINFRGNLRGGGKFGYVLDEFVNNLGDSLEEGDVVVIARTGELAYGPRDNIPIPEVDLAKDAYDTRVCGIVSEVAGELAQENGQKPRSRRGSAKRGKKAEVLVRRAFSSAEIAEMGHDKVEPGQIGGMVTLGAFGHCKVDADVAAIAPGDLLTTSATPGHAQKMVDGDRATGAILGKALGSLDKGKGKIPVLVMLQ